MSLIPLRDVSLYVKVIGTGDPIAMMHGGPGLDHSTLLVFRRCADQFKLVFYDHRCNGRSNGAPVTSMTWENLTADAEALREELGFEKWAVLGQSFGGMVALEYALRYPGSLSHLLLIDTCGDIRWAQEKAPRALAEQGYSEDTVELASRFFNGQISPQEMVPAMNKFGRAYYHRLSLFKQALAMLSGLRMKMNPEALIYGNSQLLKGWSVMDRLNQILVPTLVLAGRDDFQFPPEHQEQLAARMPNAHLVIVERAGHNSVQERPAEVIRQVREFMAAT